MEFSSEHELKIITQKSMKNSINGLCKYKGATVFYKFTSLGAGINEHLGYLSFKKYHCNLCLIDVFMNVPRSFSVLLYEYCPDMDDKNGLFADISTLKEYNGFNRAFQRTYSRIVKKSFFDYPNDLLFSTRIEQVESWYRHAFDQVSVIYQGSEYNISRITNNAIDRVKSLYWIQPVIERCIHSHGDINDLNVSRKGVFCDYAYSGVNSMYSEFVVSSIAIGIQDYFDMKYHSTSYQKHEASIDANHTCFQVQIKESDSRSFSFDFFEILNNSIRNSFMEMMFTLFRPYLCDYDRLKAMFIFRLVSVRNVIYFSKADYQLLLCLIVAIEHTSSLSELERLLIGKELICQ